MADIDIEIKELVAKIIKRKPEELKPDADLFQEYKVDSLLGVEILAGLDKKYGLDIPEGKLREVKTLNDIIKFTKELLAKRK